MSDSSPSNPEISLSSPQYLSSSSPASSLQSTTSYTQTSSHPQHLQSHTLPSTYEQKKISKRIHSQPPSPAQPTDLSKLKIDSVEHLLEDSRKTCPQCKKSWKTYCPRCCLPLGHEPPKVTLPVPLDVYRHPQELEGKTTSVHAKVNEFFNSRCQ
jgi:hypothetical protein